jgi:hypothetical protein
LLLRVKTSWAVLWLRWSVTGLSPRRPWFDPRPVDALIVVDELALGQSVFGALHFYPVSIIAPMFCTRAHQILLLVAGQKGEAPEPTQSSALYAVEGALER